MKFLTDLIWYLGFPLWWVLMGFLILITFGYAAESLEKSIKHLVSHGWIQRSYW